MLYFLSHITRKMLSLKNRIFNRLEGIRSCNFVAKNYRLRLCQTKASPIYLHFFQKLKPYLGDKKLKDIRQFETVDIVAETMKHETL